MTTELKPGMTVYVPWGLEEPVEAEIVEVWGNPPTQVRVHLHIDDANDADQPVLLLAPTVLTTKEGRPLGEIQRGSAEASARRRGLAMATKGSGKRGRSSVSGRFVKQSTVKKNPRTTTNETVKRKSGGKRKSH